MVWDTKQEKALYTAQNHHEACVTWQTWLTESDVEPMASSKKRTTVEAKPCPFSGQMSRSQLGPHSFHVFLPALLLRREGYRCLAGWHH